MMNVLLHSFDPMAGAQAWSGNKAYRKGEIVSFDGVSYVASARADVEENVGIEPPHALWWTPISNVRITAIRYRRDIPRDLWLASLNAPHEWRIKNGEADDAYAERLEQLIVQRDYGTSGVMFPIESIPAKADRQAWRQAWHWDGANLVKHPGRMRAIVMGKAKHDGEQKTKRASANAEKHDDAGNAQKAKAWRDYRKQLRTVAANLAGQMSGLTVEQLASFVVAWPVEPV